MPEALYLQFRGDHLQWLLLDDDGPVRLRGHGSESEFAAATADLEWRGPTRLLMRGEDVLLTSADVPSKQAKRIVQAVPYLVEENLAADVEDSHFVIGNRLPNGAVSVAVIDRDLLDDLLARSAALGLDVRSAKVDTLCVPMFPEGPTILVGGGRAHLRTGESQGFSLEAEHFETMLSMLPEEQQASTVFLLDQDDNDDEAMRLTLASLAAGRDSPLDVRPLEDDPFEVLCRGYGASPLDLLQGEFEAEEIAGETSGSWRTVAVLCVSAFALYILLLVGQGIYLGQQATAYEEQATELYQSVFPADRNVRDLRRRWQSHLGGGSGATSGSFLALFRDTAQELPGSRLTLNNVNFNESRGDLILQIEADRSEQLVSFSQSLTELGLDAEIGTINQADEQVRGTIKVKSGASG